MKKNIIVYYFAAFHHIILKSRILGNIVLLSNRKIGQDKWRRVQKKKNFGRGKKSPRSHVKCILSFFTQSPKRRIILILYTLFWVELIS